MSNSMSCKWDLWMVAVLVCVAVVLCEATGSDMVTTVNYKEGSDPFAPVGAGVVPVARIVSAARDADYGGWFAIEHFGATNMLECVEASASFLRAL